MAYLSALLEQFQDRWPIIFKPFIIDQPLAIIGLNLFTKGRHQSASDQGIMSSK
jgi:hypothetical protein